MMIQKVTCWIVNAIFAATLLSGATFAADDPSIKGDIRGNIKSAMNKMIQHNSINNVYRIYGPVEGRLLNLTLVELHDGIVKKGDYYVSCADFRDTKGKLVDLDFLVANKEGRFIATQAVIHKIGSQKRQYHLED
jgi:hypothetical protein